MSKYGNSRAKEKVELISSHISILDSKDRLTIRCKFNFHYFNVQKASQDFSDWTHPQLIELLTKLKAFSEDSLEKWATKKLGNSVGHVLEVYDYFPNMDKTDFIEPKNIPIEVKWARFRLDSNTRVVGFVVSDEYHDRAHERTGVRFDKNTFYVVFLDANHKFYKTEKK